ncbi:hypothetical protein K435DRAFT_965381 [Dendrothele bispora CBS 962.96]|uniref:Uncharacterized protein n=1 Tax=Dendrothele bispora (strain CBS 962.96) TaxID=1314807 RepID=A0A4S8M5X8_DENBC|nr:hypothetical protein K435DRAFT_965381 [Dendrothele bispora CBS 962.96]
MSTVWEMVDDTDPRIIYAGVWHEGAGSDIIHEGIEEPLNSLSSSGNVYNNTLHVTSKNGTTVTFNFNGTSFLAVYGSLIPTWSNHSSSQNIKLTDTQCFVDGNLLYSGAITGFGTAPFEANAFPQPMSNNLICSGDIRIFQNGTSPGHHQLVINSTIVGIPFALDYIVYETMPNATPANSTVIQLGNNMVAESQDPHLVYGPGWVDTGDGTKSTNIPGSYLKVNFTGTAVSLYGVVGHGNISNAATYQLDDNPAQTFQLLPSLASSESDDSLAFTDQQLFNLSSIPAQGHMLVITHNGTSAGVPLEIQYLLVTSSPPAPPTVSDQPIQTTPSPGGKHPNTEAIIGGVVGGVFFLTLIALVTVYISKKKGESEKAKMAEKPDPFYGSHHLRMSFDPYNSGGSPEGISKAKSDTPYDPITSPLAMNTQDDPNHEWNQMRFGNLKLQQRLAVLQSRTLTGGTHSEDVPSGSSRVLHTDSGLRITGEGVFSRPEDVVEVPPNYTES